MRARLNRPGTTASLLLIGGLVNAACTASTTEPTAAARTLNLNGRYSLTVQPSSSCDAFPDRLRTVSFRAALNQQDSTLSLDVQVTVAGMQYPIRLHGSLQSNELRLRTSECERFACEAFQSDISPDETFGMCGSSVATIVDPQHITGVFTGTLEYYKVDATGGVESSTTCAAQDHVLTLEAM